MILEKDILADLHTHTIASLHAYSTLKENIDAARNRGLKYIAITDHYFNDGTDVNKKNETARLQYMEERINEVEDGIYVFGGAEFNLNQEVAYWHKLQKLSWQLVGLHSWFIDIEDSTLEDVYRCFEISSEKHYAFAHIEREIEKLDGKKYAGDEVHPEVKEFLQNVCDLAKRKNIFLELNESSISNSASNEARMKYWLAYAKQNNNLISMGTDAHYCMEVGKFTKILGLLNEIDFPKDRILNCNEDMLEALKK